MRSVWMAAVIAACGGPQGAGELGTNRLKVEWQTAPPEGEDVKVTLVVDGQPQELGTLSTTADAGVNGACRIRKADAIATELVCGATSSSRASTASTTIRTPRSARSSCARR
jgi:hypothetical protein